MLNTRPLSSFFLQIGKAALLVAIHVVNAVEPNIHMQDNKNNIVK